jgi:hypothetical protein
MSRRPAPLSYAASLVVGQPLATVPIAEASQRQPAEEEEAAAGQGRGRRPLEDAADPSVLYLHPAGKKTLRLYAVERGVKVHDLLIEAVEEWAASRGLTGPWRVPSAGPPRRRRA